THAVLPVVGPHAPALLYRGIDARRDGGVAERGREPLAALAVGERVEQVALRDEIAVDAQAGIVAPASSGGRGERARAGGVADDERALVVGRLQVLAEVALHRRL